MNKHLLVFLAIIASLGTFAGAATLNVPGSYATIEAAISAAGTNDEVVVADGTYTPASLDGIDFGGKIITVRSASGNPSACIIDCANTTRGFIFQSGEAATSILQGFTITNGNAYYGGAIECDGASPAIDNCIITNNTASYGGAIDCYNSSPTITNCIISGNNSHDDGGAIECGNGSSPDITNCLITNNTADWYGGAIDCFDTSSPAITNCTVYNNTAYANSGGIYAADVSSNPVVKNSIVWANGDDLNGATASYSCIEDGDSGAGNISTDPMFRTGPLGDFYLSQIQGGQIADSPAVDAGGDDATAIFGASHSFTTAANNTADDSTGGIVDMGYHYPDSGSVNQYLLTTSVDVSGNGTISPSHPAGQLYDEFEEVQLTATPDSGYTVESWTGTDDDSSVELSNIITIDGNETVVVKFVTATTPTVNYRLSTNVVADANGLRHGSISPKRGDYPEGTTVELLATPDEHYSVKQWTGTDNDTSTSTTNTVLIDTDKTVSVEFEENAKYTLTTGVYDVNGLADANLAYLEPNYPAGGLVYANEEITLTANPSVGYKIDFWAIGDPLIFEANDPSTYYVEEGETHSFVMSSNIEVGAFFTSAPTYTLTTLDTDGIITPSYPAGQLFTEGTVVELSTTAAPAGQVIRWHGTDQDGSIQTTNTVTMNSSTTVWVTYESTNTLHVPVQYSSISSAVAAANGGDTIVVSQKATGSYYESNIDLNGKDITIASEHPDDPCAVAKTIIDCSGGRAFLMNNNEKATIDGFTIINGIGEIHPTNPTTDIYGGAIACFNGASPTISNCVFKNCQAQGRDGVDYDPVLAADQIADWPAQIEALPKADPTGGPGTDGNPGSDGLDGLAGLDGADGGDGGDSFGGALYFDTGSDPLILNCKVISCSAVGGNGGRGQNGQNGQDGQDGQPGQDGVAGLEGTKVDDSYVTPGGDGGNGGAGGDGGAGGAGGNGGDGGIGGEAYGGAMYFAGNNNPDIQYCQIIDCYVEPGLGNSAGNAGNAGNAGDGAEGGEGGEGGDGDPAGDAGGLGSSGLGGNGGAGGTGGNAGHNGLFAYAGGIFFGDSCHAVMTDTTFTENRTDTDVSSFKYNAGNGGNGGNGGTDPATFGGNGGAGGNAGIASTSGEWSPVYGNGADGGNGGSGAGDFGAGGNGGHGSAGLTTETSGTGGTAGTGTPDGIDGVDGLLWYATPLMSNKAGGNYYGHDCTVELTRCTLSGNYTDPTFTSNDGHGGGEYYEDNCAITMNDCQYSSNIAYWPGFGGAQFLEWGSTLTMAGNEYSMNTADQSGGAVYCTWGHDIDISNTTMTDNFANEGGSRGGGIYWDNTGYTGTVDIIKSTFVNNEAAFGGGLYWYDDDSCRTTINNCLITDNVADHGAGVYFSGGEPSIEDCVFKRNYADGRWQWLEETTVEFYGGGGAIFCWSSNAAIKDSSIVDNHTSGSGGGVYFGGYEESAPELKNCLVAENVAVLDGGGILSYWYAQPTISNCTIVGNSAYDPIDTNHGRGGGLSCSYESLTTLTDSIVWGNTAISGDQIAVGSDSDPYYYQRPAELNISYSDIENWGDANSINPDAIHVETGRIITIDAASTIDIDPNFIDPYYLASDSAAIDAGSMTSIAAGLNNYSTQLDGTTDSNTVDMGFHYGLGQLTITIIGNGSVTVDPNNYNPVTDTYSGGLLTLTAVPDEGYRVKSWAGTEEAPAWNTNVNTVNMNGDKIVTVEFEINYNRTINVFGDVMGIQDALDEAVDGDTIKIHPGTYVGTGFVLNRRNITIIGDPDNPEQVVIDCQDESGGWDTGTGFVLIGDNTHSVELNGLTIINSRTRIGQWIGPVAPGMDGWPTKEDMEKYDFGHYGGAIHVLGDHVIKNCVIRNCAVAGGHASDGTDGGDPTDETDPHEPDGGDGGYGGDAGGAGIYVQWGDPQIINITIEDCIAIGGNAGNGAMGYDELADVNGLSGNGGNGGSAFGAGIYVRSGSPYFENLTVNNCAAIAGNGGNGSDGGIGMKGGYGGLPGQVKGAGIYCAIGTAPTFIDCAFNNNTVIGGNGGNGGDGGARSLHDIEGNYGGLTTNTDADQGDPRVYGGRGAGVFCDEFVVAAFTDCNFTDNIGYGAVSGLGGYSSISNWQWQPRKNYVIPSFGSGLFCSTNSMVTMQGCHIGNNRTAFIDDYSTPDFNDLDVFAGLQDINLPDYNGVNSSYDGQLIGRGGGICLWETASTALADCNIVANYAPTAGGIFSIGSEVAIADSNIASNISYAGAGILFMDSDANVTTSIIHDNAAGLQGDVDEFLGDVDFGTGGGIYSLSTDLNITDSIISDNYAKKDGAGIVFDGDIPTLERPTMMNCLVTGNTAGQSGGGVASIYFAEPRIENCTIAYNTASDANSNGGGFFGSYSSDTTIINSIFWGNTGVDGSQIALGKGGPATNYPASLDITYSDVENPNEFEGFDAIDLVFCVDETGSMSGVIESIKSSLSEVIDAVGATAPDFRIAVAAYQDYPTPDTNEPAYDFIYRDYAQFTNNPTELQEAIDTMDAWSGHGTPSIYMGLMHCIDAEALDQRLIDNSYEYLTDANSPGLGEWRESSSVAKALLLIGDMPISEPEPFGNYTREEVVENATDKSIKIYTIATGYGTDDLDVIDGYRALAEATGGSYIAAPNPDDIATAIIEAIMQAAASDKPIYLEEGCTIEGFELDVNDPNRDYMVSAGSGNIEDDPNFVYGYYLSHLAAGGSIDSNAIDAGSDLASIIGLDTYTTRIDGIYDSNIVDMGYHYSQGLPLYEITVEVVEDANYPNANGTITVEDANRFVSYDSLTNTYTFNYYEGMTAEIIAQPDANSFVKGWYDVNDVLVSSVNTLEVVVDSNSAYYVVFKKQNVTNVSGGGTALQSAVNSAENGDILIVSAGTYLGNVDIDGKELKIYGVNPDEPNVVEKVIIDCSGSNRAFKLSNVDENTVIDGFNIINAGGYGLSGGAIFVDVNSSPLIANIQISDSYVSGGSGGAVHVSTGSQAQFINIEIDNCSATNGGAIFIDTNSSPTFEGCDMTSCQATNNGGAVYAGFESSPIFINCGFFDNEASNSAGATYCSSGSYVGLEQCEFNGNTAQLYGGAVMCGISSELNVYDCNFSDNDAQFGGGVYVTEDCAGFIEETDFQGNYATDEGGGICVVDANFFVINYCSITENKSQLGGGIFAMSSPKLYIMDCNIAENSTYKVGDTGYTDANDPNTYYEYEAESYVGQGGGIYAFESINTLSNSQLNDNVAKTSGGGVYFSGQSQPNMFNCLVKYNQAGRDGSGVSANWDTQLLMSNCTITNNTVTGDGYLESYGGGISVAYYAFVEVINSIIWNNTADYGPGISIGSNFDSSEKPMAEASISYSNVRGGQANIFVDTDHGSILNWDAATNLIGTSLDSPLFVTGYWGDFYLSQPDANSNDPFQTVQSPCVDSGSDLALNLDMFRHTTRTDHIIDFDNVDMGYHYPLTTDILGDFNYDGEVNAIDLALFMPYWLNEGCDFPLWCHGRDLNYDGIVNFGDYAIFAANYGLEETTPPEPNPMTWAMTPLSYSYSEIIMQATTAKDTSGSPVEYYFEATTGAGHDRDWDPCDTYIDSGLSSGSLYGYRVKARDKRGNETDWSVIGYAVTGEDVTTPAPDPMTWLVEPYATSPNSVRMVASTATDLSGVEYKFFETSGNLGANSSNWQTESEYEDFDLDPNTPYSYYVVARDLSPFQNTTQPSETVTVTTPVTEDVNDPNTGDVLPPEPNPSQWASVPTVTNDGFYYYHTMAAVESTNTDGTAPVLYYFDSYGGNGFDSGWQFESTYTTPGFLAENHSTYRVYATDGSGVWTSPSSWYHTYYGEQ